MGSTDSDPYFIIQNLQGPLSSRRDSHETPKSLSKSGSYCETPKDKEVKLMSQFAEAAKRAGELTKYKKLPSNISNKTSLEIRPSQLKRYSNGLTASTGVLPLQSIDTAVSKLSISPR